MYTFTYFISLDGLIIITVIIANIIVIVIYFLRGMLVTRLSSKRINKYIFE